MPTHRIEAKEVPLHKLFSSDYSFSIPDYQRPYSWTKEQAGQLLTDIEDALDGNGDQEPYFLGSVVLVKDAGVPQSDVIDGQQRLTTLAILLAVLRDLTKTDGLQIELQNMIVQPGMLALGLEANARLKLRKQDLEFFTEYVLQDNSIERLLALNANQLRSDSQRLIKENATEMFQLLQGRAETDRMKLVQMLCQHTFLVVVSTPDLSSAHRIFSVMNSRGLNLTHADIFKAKVIGAVPSADSSEYAQRWEAKEELLGRQVFADLFHHLRVILSRKRAEKEILKEFADQVLSNYMPDRGADFVDDVLVPYAEAYHKLIRFQYHATTGAAAVNAWFRRLSLLDTNDWQPAALWALRHFGHEPTHLDEFLRRLERLAASMHIRRVYSTPRTQRYAQLLREVEDMSLDAPSFDLSDDEREYTVALLDGDIYLSSRTRRYILLRLDESLALSAGVSYNVNDLVATVEHVLPQNPKNNSHWRSTFSDRQRETWVHRLSNLVLLNKAKNSQAKNFDFAYKKTSYFTGPNGVSVFALTTQVLHESDWTLDVLERRQQDLLHHLVNLWRLDQP